MKVALRLDFMIFAVKILLNHEIHETSKGDRPAAPTAFV